METRFEQGQWWACDDIRREIIPASNDPVAKKSPPGLGSRAEDTQFELVPSSSVAIRQGEEIA